MAVPDTEIDVLVCPMRPVARLADLSPEEVSDLFAAVQRVGKVVERVYKGQSLTVSCQYVGRSGQKETNC